MLRIATDVGGTFNFSIWSKEGYICAILLIIYCDSIFISINIISKRQEPRVKKEGESAREKIGQSF